ncbi:hypothetical protein [Streptomyces sp. CFMR 7]|uniref:hypothetical protein n=1 Tax=Streptomyces sp. CFMR 7 TaxID=1649184 RepID=UPI0006AD19AE|nr:hypothetical protein [Streptomyces sp. CFMR 7]
MTTATLPTRPSATGTCPNCEGSFETCSCGASPRLPRQELNSGPSAGLYDDREDADNRKGPERDETDRYHRLVRQLVVDGDRRARRAGRQAPRTLQQMAPGLDRQPVLRMVDRPLSFTPTSSKAGAGADDACVLCGRWLCGGNCFAPAPTPSMRAVTA